MKRRKTLRELVAFPGVGKVPRGRRISDIDPNWEDFSTLMGAVFDYPELLREMPDKVVFTPNRSAISAIMSSERSRIISLIDGNRLAVTEIARRLGRKQEAVSRDLGILNRFGVIGFERRGREKIPILRRTLALVPLVIQKR